MADWANLPHDILGVIALELDSIEDFVYFSAVCRSWNRAFAMVKLEWNRASIPTTPWLLLGEPNNSNNDGRRRILSIGRNKCYELSLPETFGARCWGSPYGWILMLHHNKEIELYNPITKARLNLPSILLMPFDPEDEIFEDMDDLKYWQQLCVRRFIILKMPAIDNGDEFVVMAIHWNQDYLAFARPGDQSWTPIHTTCSRYYQVIDVCLWDGLLLILYQDGTLNYCDFKMSDKCNLQPPYLTAKLYLQVPCDFLKFALIRMGEIYMVVLEGHLHVVSRMKMLHDEDNGHESYHTCGFLVHKLDVEKKMWEEVKDLGDFMLFVGNNTSIVANISKPTNCQRNAIYFTDDEIDYWDPNEYVGFRGHDMGVHDMAFPNNSAIVDPLLYLRKLYQGYQYIGGGVTPDPLVDRRGWLTDSRYKKFYQGDDALCENSSPAWFIPKF